ncbi:MAG: hypothetical protein U5L74_05760 [Ideonella sp.]|nr:hypothetical protein [Ideonella sp.]
MIELAPLAASAVALLAPLFTKALEKGAEELGQSAVGGPLGKLKEKLGHTGSQEALEDLRQQPSDADTQAALRSQLVKAMKDDPSLADKLQAWLDEAKPQAAALGIQQSAQVQGNGNKVAQVTGSGNSVNL